jgi:hypothetical protein
LSFAQPLFLSLLAALPLIVWLHFVRARRRTERVSALFLWVQAREAASQRRRVSPTWLLVAQLLFVTLLALALAQPQLRRAAAPSRVLILDASASMAAEEPQGTRLAQAVRLAEGLLDGAGEVAVVRAGLAPTVAQPLTSDHAAVRAALSALEAADANAALGEALELARALAPDAELHLIGDQAPPPGWSAPGTPLYVHPVGTPVPNVGISAFEAAFGRLFASVVSNTPYPQTLELVFERGDESVRTTVLVPAHGQANASVAVDDTGGVYRARLEGLGEDALALDNEAWIGSRELRALVSPPSTPLERALGAMPGVVVQSLLLREGSALPEADLTVWLGLPPDPLPEGDLIMFAPPQAAPTYGRVADWVRSDPLLRFVDLAGVVLPLASAEQLQAWSPLPVAEAEVLAQTSALTPALLRWRGGGRTVLFFPFYPSQTDLVRRPAFPVLLANAVAELRTDAPLPLGTPLGGGARAVAPGLFEVGERTVAASLLSAAESRLEVTAEPRAPADTVRRGEPLPELRGGARLPFWLLFVGTTLLLVEWLLWSRGRGLSSRLRRGA